MKTHLSLRTANLERSVSYYRTLLNTDPAKHFDDYALFITQEPALELALDRDSSVPVDDCAHYGVVVETSEAVDAAIARLRQAGLPIDIEREETCCYARQTKVWSADPDGRRWEIYTVIEETEVRDEAGSACCSTP